MKLKPIACNRLALGTLLVLLVTGTADGQSHFPYRSRGDYFEGVRNERPISGIDVQLMSLCAIPASGSPASSEAASEYLHLAFVLPEKFEGVEISIGGPGNYYLDRVEGDFDPGFNVFRWKSKVVEGLGINLEELDPRVAIVGGTFVPCYLDSARPSQMPSLEFYRVILQANTKGNMQYFVRDGDNLLVEDEFPVSANIPLEIHVPATSTTHHLDLHTILSFETSGGEHTIRRWFPIQVDGGEVTQVEDH